MESDMSNAINQEQRESSRPLAMPPENMEGLERSPLSSINDMLIEDLSRNYTELFIPPYNPFIDSD